MDDFTVYRQSFIADDAELSYESLNIPSAILGLEGTESEFKYCRRLSTWGYEAPSTELSLAPMSAGLPANLRTAGFRTSTREIEIETE